MEGGLRVRELKSRFSNSARTLMAAGPCTVRFLSASAARGRVSLVKETPVGRYFIRSGCALAPSSPAAGHFNDAEVASAAQI